MTWTQLLAEKRVIADPSCKSEMDNLRSIVTRCLCDFEVVGLSNEQRFIIAYDAVRTLSMMIVRAAGYRPGKVAGHYNTFAARAAADGAFAAKSSLFDLCRMKRNDSEYGFAGGVSQSEAENLVAEAKLFKPMTESWIAANAPHLA